jgi:hypothetical protein
MKEAPMKRLLLLSILSTAIARGEIKDSPGKHLDIIENGKTIVRYMYEYDNSSPENRLRTYKPFHHVMDETGEKTLTKGDGGKYTHHRGIYIGWNRLSHDGATYDLWHMKGEATQLHQKILRQESDEKQSTVTTLIHWQTKAGAHALVEERTITVHHGSGAHALIDFQSKLTADNGDVSLRGDPEHSGCQFRPHNDVAGNKSATYTFPGPKTNVKKDRRIPWVAETFALYGKHYSVQHMNHPENPGEWIHSAYRDYGRFGSTFYTDVKDGETLSVNYRIRVTLGDTPGRDALEKAYASYAGD